MPKRAPKARKPSSLPKGPKVAVSAPDAYYEKPHFSFRYTDRTPGNEWGWDLSAEGAALKVIDFLCDMSHLTWQEIGAQSTPRRGGSTRKMHHSQAISSIHKDAKAHIQKFKLDEIFGDEMFRFRLGGKPRLWGFQDGQTFYRRLVGPRAQNLRDRAMSAAVTAPRSIRTT